MTTQSKFLAVQHCLIFARIAGIAAIIAGGLVLAGWMWDIVFLKSIMAGHAVIKLNTAVCFILSGLVLWLLGRSPGQGGRADSRRKWTMVCAGVVALVGLVTLSEHFLNFDAGIDRLLFPRSLAATPGTHEGRMLGSVSASLKNLPKVPMDRRIVVNDKNATPLIAHNNREG
jgi:hypothetical protein